MSRIAPLALVAFAFAAITSHAAAPPPPAPRKVADLPLEGVSGKSIRLHDLRGRDAVVVVFVSFECPTSLGYTATLNELARRYGSGKAAFVARTVRDPST